MPGQKRFIALDVPGISILAFGAAPDCFREGIRAFCGRYFYGPVS
jgi:hypothetical protein